MLDTQTPVTKEAQTQDGDIEYEGYECYHCGNFAPVDECLSIGIGEATSESTTYNDNIRIDHSYDRVRYVCPFCRETYYDDETIRRLSDSIGERVGRIGNGGQVLLVSFALVISSVPGLFVAIVGAPLTPFQYICTVILMCFSLVGVAGMLVGYVEAAD